MSLNGKFCKLNTTVIVILLTFFCNSIYANTNNPLPARNSYDLLEIGFEQSSLIGNGLNVSGNPPRLVSGSHPVFEGNQSLSIFLDRQASPIEYRTEFTLRGEQYQKKFTEFEYGKEYWIGFAIYLDDEYQLPELGDIILQMHGKPDRHLGEHYRNPTIAFSVSGELENRKYGVNTPHWVISVIGDNRQVTPASGNPRYPTNQNAAISPAAGDVGRWVSWVIHFKHTYNPDGYLDIWKDGVQVYSQDRLRTAFNDQRGSYLKMGSYKWSWKHQHKYPTINPARRLSYLDSLRIAQGSGRYNDVVPQLIRNAPTPIQEVPATQPVIAAPIVEEPIVPVIKEASIPVPVQQPVTPPEPVITPVASGSCGKNIKLDGRNDWVNIPNLRLGSDFTIEGWVKLKRGIDYRDGLVGQEGPGSDINFYKGKVRLFAQRRDHVIAKTTIAPETWTHIAITRSGKNLSLYINGVLDATGQWGGVFTVKSLGRSNRGYLGGELDEVRIWNQFRSGNQINQNYAQSVPVNSQGLLGYWKFNEDAQIVNDSARSANHATLGASPRKFHDDPLRSKSTAPVSESCN